jgi:hypothetical protein
MYSHSRLYANKLWCVPFDSASVSFVQVAFENVARSAAVEGNGAALKACFEEDTKLRSVLGRPLYEHLIADGTVVGTSHYTSDQTLSWLAMCLRC